MAPTGACLQATREIAAADTKIVFQKEVIVTCHHRMY